MIVHPDVERYLDSLSPVYHEVLREMEAEGRQRNFPIIGPQVGRFLFGLIKFGQVQTVLECGAGFGYSAMWMALALPENGRIDCIEYRPENIEQGQAYFQKAGMAPKVNFIQGDAMTVLPALTHSYDMALNDIDKELYPDSLPLILPRLRVGGILITDNVLWKGETARPTKDQRTGAIQKFNQLLLDQKNLWSSFIPLRDGLALSVKLSKTS